MKRISPLLIFLILPVIFISVVHAQTKSNVSENQQSFTMRDVDFYEGYGRINERFEGSKGRLIICIQDAHCNAESQQNTVEILNSINKSKKIGLIALEGASGPFAIQSYWQLANHLLVADIGLYLLNQSFLTGPEYFALASELSRETALYGVEDRTLYNDDLEAFQKAHKIAQENAPFIDEIVQTVAALKSKIFTAGLAKLDAVSQDFDSGVLSFKEFFLELLASAKQYGVSLSSYPMIQKQDSALIAEPKLDYDLITKERDELVDAIGEKLGPDALSQLLVRSLEFKTARMSAMKYHNYLFALAKEHQVDTAGYSALAKYGSYITTINQINEPQLYKEINTLIETVKKDNFQQGAQLRLDAINDRLKIMAKIFKLQATNNEFLQYLAKPQEYSLRSLIDQIEQIAKEQNVTVYISPQARAADEVLPSYRAFYETALKREEPMLENMLSLMDDKKSSAAVLFAGGFHTRGLTRRLRDRKISYVVITPRVTKKELDSPYFSILSGEISPLESVFLPAGASAISPALLLAEKPLDEKRSDLRKRTMNDLFSLAYVFYQTHRKGEGVSPAELQKLIGSTLKEVVSVMGDSMSSLYLNIDGISATADSLSVPVTMVDADGLSKTIVVNMIAGQAGVSEQMREEVLRDELGEKLLELSLSRTDVSFQFYPDAYATVQGQARDGSLLSFMETRMGQERKRAGEILTRMADIRATGDSEQTVADIFGLASEKLERETAVELALELFDSARTSGDYEFAWTQLEAVKRLYSDELGSEEKTMLDNASLQTRATIAAMREKKDMIDTLKKEFREKLKSEQAFVYSMDSLFFIKVDEQTGQISWKPRQAEATFMLKLLLDTAREKGMEGKIKFAFLNLDYNVKTSEIVRALRMIGLGDEFYGEGGKNIVNADEIMEKMEKPATTVFNRNNYGQVSTGTVQSISDVVAQLVADKTNIPARNTVFFIEDKTLIAGITSAILELKQPEGDLSPFAEATTIAAIEIQTIGDMIGLQKMDTLPKGLETLVDALEKRYQGTLTEGEIIDILLGKKPIIPPPAIKPPTEYLDDMDEMEDIVVGQAA